MMDSGSAPATPVEDTTTTSTIEQQEQDPWATIAAAAGEEPPPSSTSTEPISTSHASGETFTMPESTTASTSNNTKNEFLTAVSNLGTIISTKAQEVNEQHQVSEKWNNSIAKTKQKTGELNDKYQVSENWGKVTSAVSEKVEQIKEAPKTKEATENVKRGLVGASAWVSSKFAGMNNKGGSDGSSNNNGAGGASS